LKGHPAVRAREFLFSEEVEANEAEASFVHTGFLAKEAAINLSRA
jgi:hypothetical protein